MSQWFYCFQDPPEDDENSPELLKRIAAQLRADIQTFLLGVSDSQTVIVGSLVISHHVPSKFQLSSYHFNTAIDIMIALSIITFSVALSRNYSRAHWAAGVQSLLSNPSFVRVGLTIIPNNDLHSEWRPSFDRNDSAILLPVACLLETHL